MTDSYNQTNINLGAADSIIQDLAFSFVYQPGGTAVPGVVTSWATAKAIIESQNGKGFIIVDDSIVSPAPIDASTDMRDVVLGARLQGTPTFAEVTEGVVLSNLTHMRALTLNNASSAPAIILDSGDVLLLEFGAGLSSSAAPCVSVIGTVPPLPTIRLFEGGGFIGPTPAVDAVAGALLLVQFGAGSSNAIDSISGAAGASGFAVILDSSSAFRDPSGDAVWLGGAWTVVLLPKASLESYTPAVAAQWVAPPPGNQQDALDRMAALLFANFGAIP